MTDAPRVLLGHGTENDFVVLPDPDGTVWPEDRLDVALVRRLCDRRAGVGGDGVLTPAEAKERTASTTRRFVRRQRSWFRRDAALTWFDAARPDLADAVTAEITARTITQRT